MQWQYFYLTKSNFRDGKVMVWREIAEFIIYFIPMCTFFVLQMCPDINNWLKLLSLHGKKKESLSSVFVSFSTMDASILALVLEASDDSEFEAIEHLGTFYDGSSETTIVPVISSCSTDCPKQLFNHCIEGFYRNDIPRYNDPTFKAHFRMKRTTFQVYNATTID